MNNFDKKLSRRPLSLIEILIVISILAIFSGTLTINVRNALMNQRFRTEVDGIVDSMRLAQDLMLIMDTDVHFKIRASADGSGLEYWLETEQNFPPKWNWVFERYPKKLKDIHYVNFIEDNPPEQGVIDLKFLSGGSVMSRGTFRVATHEDINTPGVSKRVICLKGYPHSIMSQEEKEGETIECEPEAEDEATDQRLTYTMQQEIEQIEEEKKQLDNQGTEQGKGQNQDQTQGQSNNQGSQGQTKTGSGSGSIQMP